MTEGEPAFVQELVEQLAARGVSHVRIERHGVPAHASDRRSASPVPHHMFLIETAARSDHDLASHVGPRAANIRKVERAAVEVAEIRTEAEMDIFANRMAETAERMRSAAVYPEMFFRTVFRRMVPRGQALFLLTRSHDQPLAAQMYLVGADRLTYYHGAFTRDRELTPKHSPTATFWHALRLAAKRGLRVLDMGAGTRRAIEPTPIFP